MRKTKLSNIYKSSLAIILSTLMLFTSCIAGQVSAFSESENVAAPTDVQIESGTVEETVPTENSTEAQTENPVVNDNIKENTQEVNASVIYGDVDGSGKVNMEDGVILAKYVAGGIKFTNTQKQKADLDLDGKIDINDIIILNKYIAKIITELPYDPGTVPQAISLSTTKLTLNTDTTFQIKTIVSPANASYTLSWSSSDKKVADVSNSGNITAKNAGKANITVKTNNGKTAVCAVTVQSAPIFAHINISNLTLGTGESYTLNPVVVPAECTPDQYSFMSDNKAVAEVSSKGVITAKAAGTATVTLKTNNNISSSCVVTVKNAPSSVSLSDTRLTMDENETYIISESTNSGSYAKECTWSSSNKNVATVAKTTSNKAKITAIGAGTANITVKTYNGKTAVCTVTVRPDPIFAHINISNLTLGAGESYTLSPVVVPAECTPDQYSFTSNNKAVAEVSGKGVITAKAAGTATVTLKTNNNISSSCVVTVKNAPSSVSLSDTSLTVGIGETYIISESTNSGSYAKGFTWSSSNKNVATVAKTTSNKAKITAIGAGTATVTIKTYNGKTATCKVTVKNAPSSVSLSSTSLTVGVGETYIISESTNSGSYAKEHTWSSSNKNVATVAKTTSNKAKITAIGVGTATVTIKTYNGKTATCKVTVKNAPASISINKSSVNLTVGETVNVYESTNSGSYAKEFTWSSSNASVATVEKTTSNNAKITAKAAGKATISVKTYNGKTASCVVTVTKKASNTVTAIKLSSTASSINAGNHAYIKATTTPANQKVNWSSSNTSVATVSNGIVKGVSSGTATITAKSANSSVSASYKITVTAQNSGGLSIIYTSCSANAGQTVYMKPNASSVTLSSSNTNVATVDSKGFVKAKSNGVAIITASKNGYKKTCALTVTDAAPIRFSYSSPNSAALNDTITFIAITDKSRTAVKFTYTVSGIQYTVNATSKSVDSTGNNYVWKGSKKVGVAGSFAVTAYSMKNNSWGTCDAGKSTMYITNASSSSSVSASRRRPSDKLLALNSNYEGYLSSVSDDPLVYDTPTIGYGHVVYAGDKFYNNLSTQEAFAWMISDMNDSVYSNSVNNFMESYNIKFNQQQFDSLVMLVYNLGSGVLSNSDVRSILTNCVESNGSTSSTSATVNADALNVRSGPGTSYSSYGTIPYGTRVTVLEKTTSTWYKVRTPSGTVGYCSAEYLTFTSSVVRNMNLVNKTALKSELIQWHHAGGQCVWGLLYRRIDELEVFCYGDYIRDGDKNKYNMPYRWNC